MLKSRTSWREKLEKEQGLPKIVKAKKKMLGIEKGKKLLIPKPLDVDELMRKVRKGKLITVNQIREKLAKKFHTDTTCPLVTGIFINIAAHTAEEDKSKGKKNITPYWRVLKKGGILNEKYPGGEKAQALKLKKEGHVIEQKGKKLKVKDFEKKLQKL